MPPRYLVVDRSLHREAQLSNQTGWSLRLLAVPVYALGDQVPSIHRDAYVHPDAVVIGAVVIGANSSVWPGAVLRGDDGEIIIGQRTSVQDNCVLHTTAEQRTVVGDDCVIGHLVHLEGCRIESWSLIGNGSIVLHRVVVNSWAIVAANAVVLNDTIVPSGALAVGTPAVIKEGRARRDDIERGVATYVARAAQFRTALRRID
jgi:carbonic anhydrase/acetyltransferase-like protein (isoleucine patch superfamily)